MKHLRNGVLLFLAILVALSCNKKHDLESKLGIANRTYKLTLLTSRNIVKDTFGFHEEYDSVIINQSVSLQIDSSAKKATYNATDIFYSSDSSLNNYYSTSLSDPQVVRQELKLRNDSIFVGKNILVGNIGHGESYVGIRIY